MFTERFERGSHFISMSSMIVQVSVVLKSITLSLLGFPPFRFQWIRTLHGQKRYCACVGICRKEFNNQSEYLRERTVKWLHRSNAHDAKEIFGRLETLTAVKRCSATTEFGDLEMLVFAERWKPEFSVQNLSGKGREPTNGNHIWCNTETWTKATHYWQANALNGCTDNIACDTCVFWEQYNSLKLSDAEVKCKRHPVHESNYGLKLSRLPL